MPQTKQDWAQMNEAELRDADVPWLKTEEELMALIRLLVGRAHDYGTCVYAMSIAATAALYYVAGKLGTTGFQMSIADLDVPRRNRGLQHFFIRDLGDLLYPQYAHKFKGYAELIDENLEWLQEQAAEKLADGQMHPEVQAHLEALRDGRNPARPVDSVPSVPPC